MRANLYLSEGVRTLYVCIGVVWVTKLIFRRLCREKWCFSGFSMTFTPSFLWVKAGSVLRLTEEGAFVLCAAVGEDFINEWGQRSVLSASNSHCSVWLRNVEAWALDYCVRGCGRVSSASLYIGHGEGSSRSGIGATHRSHHVLKEAVILGCCGRTSVTGYSCWHLLVRLICREEFEGSHHLLLLRWRPIIILAVTIWHGLRGIVLIFAPPEQLSDVLLALFDLALQADGVYFEEAHLVAHFLVYLCGSCTMSCVWCKKIRIIKILKKFTYFADFESQTSCWSLQLLDARLTGRHRILDWCAGISRLSEQLSPVHFHGSDALGSLVCFGGLRAPGGS